MRRQNRISLSDAAEMNRGEMAINEIDARAEDKTWKPGLLLRPNGCVTEIVSSRIHGVWPVGYVLPVSGRPSPGHGIGPSAYYWRGRVPAHGARPHGPLTGFVAWRRYHRDAQIFALRKLREAFDLDDRPILPPIKLPLQPANAGQQEDSPHAEQNLIHERGAAMM